MSYNYGLPEGVARLGHAIGHAAFLYGDPISDYEPIIHEAVHARHATDMTAARESYAITRARELVAESDSNQCLASSEAMSRWIGSATEILRELTRDA